ncbi:MAG: TIGR01620 family protein, partial [Halopseudomonas sp.]
RKPTSEHPHILETWEPAPERPPEEVRVLGESVEQLKPRELPDEVPLPGTLNAPAVSPWPARLGKLLMGVVVGAAVLEWSRWTLDAWAWNPLAGGLLGALGVGLAGTALLSWRALRQQRQRLTALEQLRMEMRVALADPGERLALDWLERLQALYRDTPLAARMALVCDGLDQSHSAQEVSRRLNQQFYQALDIQARRMIRSESVSTGMLVATSPWVSVDLLLVVWRNIRMMQRVAICYGLPMGQLGRWRLARHVLRNIALAGGSEMAIGALSDSLLSGMLEKLAARIGQGIGIGLYSSRLGHFTLDLCRAAPLADQSSLEEDNRGVIQGIRTRLGRKADDRL